MLRRMNFVFIALALTGCAETFLSSAHFSGSFTPAPTVAPIFGGKSTYDGAVVFTNLDRSIVAAALPDDLQLAPNISDTPGKHPVIFIISHHANMDFLIPGPDPPYPNAYEELILLIPFVQHEAGTKWHTLVERMYLNDLIAISTGNLYYGYAKQFGTFERQDSDLAPVNFKVRKTGTPYFSAQLELKGPWVTGVSAETAFANFTRMQEIFTMPLIGRNAGAWPLLEYVCSYFQWDFSTAFVRPVKSRHEFLQPFTAASGAWATLGELASVKNGAVAIRNMEFRIFYPAFPCQF